METSDPSHPSDDDIIRAFINVLKHLGADIIPKQEMDDDGGTIGAYSMPWPTDEDAPHFEDQPHLFDVFCHHFVSLAQRAKIDQSQWKSLIVTYLGASERDLWMVHSTWRDPAVSYDEFICDIRPLYEDDIRYIRKMSLADFDATLESWSTCAFYDEDNILHYQRDFNKHSNSLSAQGIVHNAQEMFLSVFSASDRREIVHRLQILDPDRPYHQQPISSIASAARFVIRNQQYANVDFDLQPLAPPSASIVSIAPLAPQPRHASTIPVDMPILIGPTLVNHPTRDLPSITRVQGTPRPNSVVRPALVELPRLPLFAHIPPRLPTPPLCNSRLQRYDTPPHFDKHIVDKMPSRTRTTSDTTSGLLQPVHHRFENRLDFVPWQVKRGAQQPLLLEYSGSDGKHGGGVIPVQTMPIDFAMEEEPNTAPDLDYQSLFFITDDVGCFDLKYPADAHVTQSIVQDIIINMVLLTAYFITYAQHCITIAIGFGNEHLVAQVTAAISGLSQSSLAGFRVITSYFASDTALPQPQSNIPPVLHNPTGIITTTWSIFMLCAHLDGKGTRDVPI
ncbi:hypothetical protein EXIGLDRAFT_778176 [Exidia glandulosa HHB12029]|uniref:Uncharacterized protein n=1 Tax=Exidia glandulosa HHB12029 TaxID=1314781 RepID=A0A165CNK3_EXIGL|nr:hypothetical protein EXIGLDRAFT_778176 [Exidia glandulosa HHB12029]